MVVRILQHCGTFAPPKEELPPSEKASYGKSKREIFPERKPESKARLCCTFTTGEVESTLLKTSLSEVIKVIITYVRPVFKISIDYGGLL